MRGLLVEAGRLRLAEDLPEPQPLAGETRVRVLRAGVCATDLALARGYMDFAGVPGHEFVGLALDGPLAGRRVVGEINAGCGSCPVCSAEAGPEQHGALDQRHCPQRTVLGILGRQGAFAEVLRLPDRNLLAVPESCPTDAAVFCEPLAAAYALHDAASLEPGGQALVVGDGRLGLLCAHVLVEAGLDVTIAGRHPERAGWLRGPAQHVTGLFEPGGRPPRQAFELVVEASGHPDVLALALGAVRPRGALVLKTTTERPVTLDLSALVVDEIRLVGSRCGRFWPALDDLVRGRAPTEPMIHGRYALRDAVRAMRRAGEPGTCKILIDMESEE